MALTLYDPHDLLLGHLPHSYIGMKLSTPFEELQTILELSPCFLSAGQLLFPGGTLYIFCSSPVNIKEYSSHKQPQTWAFSAVVNTNNKTQFYTPSPFIL